MPGVLPPSKWRGNRLHVLDWTGSELVREELAALLLPLSGSIEATAPFMPAGHGRVEEARLESFGPRAFQNHPAWAALQSWWLCHPSGANTPNWDMATVCTLGATRALLLVEAKANVPELSESGKVLRGRLTDVRDVYGRRMRNDPSDNARENHERIGEAVREANDAWSALDARVRLSAAHSYQLANRLAFTWKLATLGIPTVLLYLGFTGDEGIAHPFTDASHWEREFAAHANTLLPVELREKELDFGGSAAPAWVLCRSRPVMRHSPASP